jgi:CubicO group peptidase (beta-lactamase class C family)
VLRALYMLGVCLFGTGTTCAVAQSPVDDTWSALDAHLERVASGLGSGVVMLVRKDEDTLYEKAFAPMNLGSVVPIASSTKMPSALAILTLVDHGAIKLDEPVTTYISSRIRWPPDKATITLRMLLNHTSGLAIETPCMQEQVINWTLRSCVQQIADAPLDFEPGTQFGYGGGGFQVAGYVAEAVTHRRWVEFFRDAITQPLGLKNFTYGDTGNPNLAGGAASDVYDYDRLLRLVIEGGTVNGVRIVSPETANIFRIDQIAGLPKFRTPGGEWMKGYSFGLWLSDQDPVPHPETHGPLLLDPGAFGAVPWIDLSLRYRATLLIFDKTRKAGWIAGDSMRIIAKAMQRSATQR